MLRVVTAKEALQIITAQFSDLQAEKETVPLCACTGRILYEDITANENVPAFDRSTVDGYAVRAADTYGCSEASPAQLFIAGEISMGEEAACTLKAEECAKIATGGMLPAGADSVVMSEHTDESFVGYALVCKSASPFENVTKKGDDIKKGSPLFRKGETLTSRHIGVLAAAGIGNVAVCKKIKVGILSTGDEIVPAEQALQPGQVRDINTHSLTALLQETGCEPTAYGIVADNEDSIRTAVRKAVAENDIVLISGGSSAGVRDMTADILSSLGEVYFHGIAMKPGKPTILGRVGNTAVFGLPGHPTAAYFVALRFVVALADGIYARRPTNRKCRAIAAQNISSNHGREELVCVRLLGATATPVFGKSGIISLLTQSDGYIIIDRDLEGIKQGEEVSVILF